jgi:Saccharopine dehydrogenase and related proteins
MKKIVVLGAGMVGRAIARDLANQFSVTSVDINEENLALLKPFGIQTEVANLTNPPEIENAIGKADLVVSAVPGFMGKNTIEVVLENSKNVVDISFFPEDSAYLHEMAMEYGVTAFIDFGVAPGLSNLWFGNQYSKGGVKFLECMVGGLPVERKLPFQYKAPFSPIDVIEEYTRPARVKERGQHRRSRSNVWK